VAPPPPWHRTAGRWAAPGAWAVGAVPLALLLLAALTTGLTAEPIEFVTHRTGFAALSLLMASLALTPLRRWTGWNWLAPARRALGLSAFGYALLHFGVYLFDQGFSAPYVVEDVVERPYVTAGFLALLLLVPLAATSTRAAIRRMGKRWQKLHRLVYLAAGLGVLHFLWLVKADLRRPLVFATIFALLMLLRLPRLAPRRTHGRPRDV
jgi:methionine sulfoxide reductase heme-binding subunit